MQAIIFIGIQATGKSSFYKKYFFNSHVRISMDLLRTRYRENQFLNTCFQTHARFVVDNTNPTLAERQKYITLAKANKYKITGYFFQSNLSEALQRNNQREGRERVPDVGLYSCRKNLVLPSLTEGFDELFYVQLQQNDFLVREWQ